MDMKQLEYAIRRNLTFASSKGQLGVGDLYELTPSKLDELHRFYSKQVSPDAGGLISVKSLAARENSLRLVIIKHVFDTLATESAARIDATARKERNQRRMAIIEDKRLNQESAKSIEELTALLEPETVDSIPGLD